MKKIHGIIKLIGVLLLITIILRLVTLLIGMDSQESWEAVGRAGMVLGMVVVVGSYRHSNVFSGIYTIYSMKFFGDLLLLVARGSIVGIGAYLFAEGVILAFQKSSFLLIPIGMILWRVGELVLEKE